MLYELGEGAPEEALRPNSGALAQLVLALMQVRRRWPCEWGVYPWALRPLAGSRCLHQCCAAPSPCPCPWP
jgi:hypothetical protein